MRFVNRLLAALLSLGLIAAGVLVIVEVIADRTQHRPAVVKWHGAYDWAHRTSWTQGGVRAVCIAAAAVGLVLLVAELKRARVKRFDVDVDVDAGGEGRQGIAVAYTRRGVAQAVRSAVTDVDGVRSSGVKVSRRVIRVRAATSARDSGAAQALLEPATAAARAGLDSLQLRRPPRLKVSTTARRK